MTASDDGRTRPPWVDVLERYREASGRPWYEIDAAAGVNPKTREQWLSGLVKSPPLIGIARISKVLGVPPDKLFDAVLGVAQPADELTLSERIERLERIVLNRASDQEVLELEAALNEVLGDPNRTRADEAR